MASSGSPPAGLVCQKHPATCHQKNKHPGRCKTKHHPGPTSAATQGIVIVSRLTTAAKPKVAREAETTANGEYDLRMYRPFRAPQQSNTPAHPFQAPRNPAQDVVNFFESITAGAKTPSNSNGNTSSRQSGYSHHVVQQQRTHQSFQYAAGAEGKIPTMTQPKDETNINLPQKSRSRSAPGSGHSASGHCGSPPKRKLIASNKGTTRPPSRRRITSSSKPTSNGQSMRNGTNAHPGLSAGSAASGRNNCEQRMQGAMTMAPISQRPIDMTGYAERTARIHAVCRKHGSIGNTTSDTSNYDDKHGQTAKHEAAFFIHEALDDETPEKIAKKFRVSLSELLGLNQRFSGINWRSKLKAGTTISVPCEVRSYMSQQYYQQYGSCSEVLVSARQIILFALVDDKFKSCLYPSAPM